MAEQGKGDERWIVNERTDGRNVNSWHWEEKQRLPWAKERLEALLLVSGGSEKLAAAVARVTAVREVTGEATTTTRKGGRRFPVYDLKVTAAWSVGGDEAAAAAAAADGTEEKKAEENGERASGNGGGSGSDGGGDDDKAKKKKDKARTGTVVIEELSSTHEPEDYVLTFKADGAAAEDAAARAEAQRLLTAPLLAALAAFCGEIAAL